MIIKTTLCGSNPQVIREFYIEDERTVGELLSVIAIVHNWDQGHPLKLIEGDYASEITKNLKELKQNKEALYISLFVTNRHRLSGFEHGEEKEEWTLRLEIVGDEETDIEERSPRLLRFRGLHPELSCRNMENWNFTHQRLIHGDHYYGNPSKNSDSQLVDVNKINLLLRRRLVMKKKDIYLNRNCCHDFTNILNGYKVEELKNIVREKMWGINMNQRKNDLIHDMIDFYCRGYLQDILEEMEIEEYNAFRDLCFHGNQGWDWKKSLFPLLRQRCLLDTRYSLPHIPNELMDYYESFLLETGDEILVLKKKVRKVIRAASNLYGVFTKAMCKQLAVIMYPKEIDPKDISLEWKETDNWKILNKYTMYSSYQMDDLSAFDIMGDPLLETYGYYIPSRDEAFQIADGIINYSIKGQKLLRDCLAVMKIRRFYYWDDTTQKDRIIRVLYDMSHLGIASEQIKSYLKNQCHLEGTPKQFNNLLKTVDELRSGVRSVDLHGYTEEEISKMSR